MSARQRISVTSFSSQISSNCWFPVLCRQPMLLLTRQYRRLYVISADLNRARSTVVAYITAIRQAAKGTFVHQSSSGVRPEPIEPYLRKEGKAKQIENDLMMDLIKAEVRMENTQESRKENRGRQMLDAENALLSAGEIEAKTPIDIISRLMKVDMMTVNRVRSYIGLLKGRENDKSLEFRQECAFAPETFEALETRYGFFLKEKTPEDLEAEFRRNLLTSIDLMNDILNSIDDMMRKMVKEYYSKKASEGL